MSIQTRHCTSREEVATALQEDARARFLGGGTLLMRAVNEADPAVGTLVTLARSTVADAGARIRVDGSHLMIDALTTMSELLASRDARCLHAAARLIGGPAIRNMATTGGNLFAPSPYGDLATALLALDADVGIAGSEQRLSLQSLLQQRNTGPSRLVSDIRCRRPARDEEFRYLKVSRVKPKGISVLCLAALLPGVGGRLQGVRVAYGAMAATPVRVTAVEQALEGQTLDNARVDAAVRVAVDGLDPPGDAIASAWYRRQVAPVHLARLLRGEHASTGSRR